MPAVTPAEPHNPERYGSSNAIRRQDWRRGTHDCALHFRAWPGGLRAPPQAAAPQCGASRQTCHAGGHAGRATHTRAAREFQSPSAAKTGGVARTTARSSSSRRPPMWSKPPDLPCRRSRRQNHTIPNGTGVPTPSAAKTGGVARTTARSTSARGTHDCALHLKPPPPDVEHAARLAMPAVTPAEPHNPERYGSSNAIPPARLRPPPQPAASPPISVFSVFSVVWFSPCPLWFAFSVSSVFSVVCFFVPSHPQSQRSPNLFPFLFQPLPNSPFLLLLLPSCMLKVKGAADALVGARTADGASPDMGRPCQA